MTYLEGTPVSIYYVVVQWKLIHTVGLITTNFHLIPSFQNWDEVFYFYLIMIYQFINIDARHDFCVIEN